MNQQTAAKDVEMILSKAGGDQAAALACQSVRSEIWEELLEEDPERWDGMG